ncbi:AMP-binding protein [Rhodobacterales bacterium HKCCE2091]|nr:AMP-binding protein [Rhodobacterales bacterium HKCCE2091]
MMELSDWLDKIVHLEADGWVIEYDGHQIGRAELRAAVEDISETLVRAGVPDGGRVGVVMRNRPGIVAALLACIITRRTIVSINPFLPPATLLTEVRDLSTDAVIGDPSDLTDDLLAAAASNGSARIAVTLGAARLLAEMHPDRTAPERDERGFVALQLLSSGTTGKPKRIDLAARTLADAMADVMTKPEDKAGNPKPKRSPTVVSAPILHVAGWLGMLGSLLEARPIVMMERFEVDAWVSAVSRHRIKSASLGPTPMRMLLDANPPKEALSSLIAVRTGTAPLPPETQKEFQDRYGIAVLIQYGASEWMGGVAGWTFEDFRAFGASKLGSVGRARGDIRLRVVDPDTGAELPADEVGVLEVLPVGRVDSDEWARTSDSASIDADGFVYIHGRTDDMILRGGFKVEAAKVAAALERHPAILEAAVLGLPDARLGEVPVAALEPAPGAEPPSEAELEQFARETLLAYQVPARFVVMEKLPRTYSMKVDRPVLRKLLESDIAAATG